MLGDRVDRLSPVRGLFVCVLAAAVVVVLTLLVASDLRAARAAFVSGRVAEQRFDVLLVWGCEAVAVATACWLAILTMLVVLDAAKGRERLRAGCPSWLRRIIWAACGMGVAVAITSPAQASLADGTSAAGAPAAAAAMQGLAYPDRPEDSVRAPQRPHPPTTAGSQRATHVVVRDDTLWDIAAASLAPRATDAEIAERWRQIFADNADALGPDPDLIHPGTVLRVPEA